MKRGTRRVGRFELTAWPCPSTHPHSGSVDPRRVTLVPPEKVNLVQSDEVCQVHPNEIQGDTPCTREALYCGFVSEAELSEEL